MNNKVMFFSFKVRRILLIVIYTVIKFYQYFLSPIKKNFGYGCRYYPCCSEYALLCLKKYSLKKATFFSIRRLISCGPWSRGGVDYP